MIGPCGDTDFNTIHAIINDGAETHPLRPGSVAVIPAGMPHFLAAEPGQKLEFVIFGTPPITMNDERARPVKPVG